MHGNLLYLQYWIIFLIFIYFALQDPPTLKSV